MPNRASRQARNRSRNNRRRNRTQRPQSPEKSESPDNMKMLQEELRTSALRSGQMWDCPVCLETLDPKQFTFTNCSHKMCSKCFADTRISKCPICREDMGKGDITPEWESESEEEAEIPTGVFTAENMENAPALIRDLFNLLQNAPNTSSLERHINANERRFLRVASQEQKDSLCNINLSRENVELGRDKLFVAYDMFDVRNAEVIKKGFYIFDLDDHPDILRMIQGNHEDLSGPIQVVISQYIHDEIDGFKFGDPWIAYPCLITNIYENICSMCNDNYLPPIYKLYTRMTAKLFHEEWIESLYDVDTFNSKVRIMGSLIDRFDDDDELRKYFRNSKKKLVTMNETIAPMMLVDSLRHVLYEVMDYFHQNLFAFDNNIDQFMINLNQKIKTEVDSCVAGFGFSHHAEIVNDKSKYENMINTFLKHLQFLCIVPPVNQFSSYYVTNVEEINFTYNIEDPQEVTYNRIRNPLPIQQFKTKYNMPDLQVRTTTGHPTD